MILAVRSDKPEAEIYLLDNNGTVVRQKIWDAGRTLAKNLLGELDELVNGDFDQLTGLIAYKGPGSFTGLRIGITTQNAIAYGKQLPIVGTTGENWLADGVQRLQDNQNDKIVLPDYGAAPHITKPKP